MMALFSDTSFFVLAGILAVPALILGLREKPIKYYGFAVTLVFVWLSMGHNTAALCWLAAFCVGEYALIQAYLALNKKYRRNKWIYFAALALSISPLVTYKILSAVGNSHHIWGFLGISYLTFKAAQIVIEIYDQVITEVKAFDFFYLMLFFPDITSGPIDRSRRFSEDINRVIHKSEYAEMAGTGLHRILIGMVYKMVLGTGFYQIMATQGEHLTIKSLLIYIYCYGFYLFFDFAGYSHMAIGISYIFGVKTPENFDKPFVSKDMKEFWDRWHITLSHWFRDFIFSRVTMNMIRHRWTRNKLVIASTAFMVNMLVMGFWHGLEPYYIAYGLYHGVLLSLTEIYQKKSKFYKKHKRDKWFQVIEWFITFNLVMFGFFIFSGRLHHLIVTGKIGVIF
ncbi:MAG: D-alanyl-lipoteichoic acid biosynthesis protein DltB [Eubacteriales bacterium]|nr:D-alanyl-lipoteichoic acid biosynthesis protein DltB [Eubacteriales bacterium]